MDKPNISASQQAWIDRGLTPEQAAGIEKKISEGEKGVLKGAAGQRFVSELRENPELAKRYAEAAAEMDPAKFLGQIISLMEVGPKVEKLKVDATKLREAIVKVQVEINEIKVLLDNYQAGISEFLYPGLDFGKDKVISNVQSLGRELKTKITNLSSTAAAKIKYCVLILSSLIEELKMSENQEAKIKGIEKNLVKLKNLAGFLGIDLKQTFLPNLIDDQLNSKSSEDILKSLGMSLEEDSEASLLIKIGEKLKLFNQELQKKYEINEANHDLLKQIEEQTNIVSENCWKVAFIKAITDFFENLVNWIFEYFDEEKLEMSRTSQKSHEEDMGWEEEEKINKEP